MGTRKDTETKRYADYGFLVGEFKPGKMPRFIPYAPLGVEIAVLKSADGKITVLARRLNREDD